MRAEQDNEVNETVRVYTAAADTVYNNLAGDVVTVTVTDHRQAGDVVSGVTVYADVLASERSSASVTVTATSDESAVTVSPTSLTFTTTNWAAAQTVTVTRSTETVRVTYTATRSPSTTTWRDGDGDRQRGRVCRYTAGLKPVA